MPGSQGGLTGSGGHHADLSQGLVPNQDRVIGELDAAMRQSPIASSLAELAGDSLGSGTLEQLRHNNDGPRILQGRVVQALPFIGWYKVQIDRLNSSIGCCLGAISSYQPLGVRVATTVPTGSQVVVFLPPQSSRGVILAVMPHRMYKSDFMRPDWIQQGSTTGFKREQAHYEGVKIYEEEGNTDDYSSGRPIDQTAQGEQAWFGPFGTALFVDDFQAYLRISEICGLFLNWFDHYMRLAGWNMDIQSAAHQVTARLDEGETQFEEGFAIYPWEGLGGYSDQSKLWAEFDDKDVQYEKPLGKIDEVDAEEKLEVLPILRAKRYGGYLGQGGRRLLMRPRDVTGSGVEKLSTEGNPEYTLFEENVGLDGDWWVRGSKELHLIKRLPGPHPKQRKLPEDQKEGEVDNQDSYKFSGKNGSGSDHEVGDIVNKEDQLPSLKRCAGVIDLHTYICNFKNLHPFHYHMKDYLTPEESSLGDFSTVTDQLNFGSLASQMYMDDPTPVQLEVDHRYGEVDYYKRTSYLSMLNDGAVLLGCGYGAEVKMVNGHLFLSAPGDIWLQAGRSVRLWSGDDIDIRAKNSIDVVATEKDVRVKAEKNYECLAGNGGEGGMIFDNRSTVSDREYEPDKPGEDVKGAGILFRATQSEVFTYAAGIYLRTGNDDADIGNGDIVLDAAKGEGNITINAREENHFLGEVGQINFYWGVIEEDEFNVRKADCLSQFENNWGAGVSSGITHRFGGNIACVGSGNALFEGGLTLVEGTGNQPLSDSWGILRGEGLQIAKENVRLAKEQLQECSDAASDKFTERLQTDYYADDKIGNMEVQQKIMFSFRNDMEGEQYNAGDFKLAETRWQQYARLQIGTGGSTWTEKAVEYQGEELYPYPGKKAWKEDPTFLQLKEYTMFDPAKLQSKDRISGEDTAEAYTKREIEVWNPPPVPPDGAYQTIM